MPLMAALWSRSAAVLPEALRSLAIVPQGRLGLRMGRCQPNDYAVARQSYFANRSAFVLPHRWSPGVRGLSLPPLVDEISIRVRQAGATAAVPTRQLIIVAQMGCPEDPNSTCGGFFVESGHVFQDVRGAGRPLDFGRFTALEIGHLMILEMMVEKG